MDVDSPSHMVLVTHPRFKTGQSASLGIEDREIYPRLCIVCSYTRSHVGSLID